MKYSLLALATLTFTASCGWRDPIQVVEVHSADEASSPENRIVKTSQSPPSSTPDVKPDPIRKRPPLRISDDLLALPDESEFQPSAKPDENGDATIITRPPTD